MRSPVVVPLAGAIAAALLGACSFDVRGVGGGGPGDDAAVDADVDAAPCAPGCEGDALRACDGGAPVTIPCELGCSERGEPHCRVVVPSNGAPVGALDGVAAGLVVAAGHVVTVTTGDGAIVDRDVIGGAVVAVRAAGDGVRDGIGFEVVGDHAVLAVEALTVEAGGNLVVEGPRPLILLVRDAAVIRGWVDVAGGCEVDGAYVRSCPGPGGGRGATGGGGASATGCAPGGNGHYSATIGVDETGGGGGGLGQDGAHSGAAGGNFGAGGSAIACPPLALVPLAGGSGGGAARLDTPGTLWAHGGGGGGALQVTSLVGIELRGTAGSPAGIDATGAGGQVSDDDDGGGGGGSGGAVLLEAPVIVLDTAGVFAGGGGGGAGRPPSSPGGAAPANGHGQAGRWSAEVALGGVGGGDGSVGRGGHGGIGGDAPAPPTSGAGNVDGTGGGGGGAGILRINTRPGGLTREAFVTTALSSTGAVASQ